MVKLVTIAIHTLERAKLLKSVLEAEGIKVTLYNLDLFKPIFSAGVRVRIAEKDLPRALQIIETSENGTILERNRSKILVPVDLSRESEKIVEASFRFAQHIDADIVFLYSYFMPDHSFFPNRTEAAYVKDLEQKQQSIILEESTNFKQFISGVEQKIVDGVLPKIKYMYVMEEGVPEDAIVDWAKNNNPQIIIMGTGAKNTKGIELLGSVTAEVMERSSVPVLAIPENIDLKGIEKLNNVMFATNIDDRMLTSLDKTLMLLKKQSYNLFLTHFEQKQDAWNEIKLAGLCDYLEKTYPMVKTEYSLIKGDDLLQSFEDFIREKQINLVVINTHRRNIFMRLFNPSIARKMLFHSDTPILVVRV